MLRREFNRALVVSTLAGLAACRKPHEAGTAGANANGARTKVRLQLNWLPEPEFGGFYAAQELGIFKKYGLDVEILKGSAGIATPQLAASGQVDFAIVTADQVAAMRAQGAPLLAVFASFQTSPRAIAVHESSPHTSLEALWRSDAKIVVEPGQPYVKWLNHQYDGSKLQLVASQGGLAGFLRDQTLAQGVYIFAEPAEFAERGVPVRVFPVASSGYNPYEVVVATRDELMQKDQKLVERFVRAVREGWTAYLSDPAPTNIEMSRQNPAMSVETMERAAGLALPYIQTQDVELGAMDLARWSILVDQLAAIGVIPAKIDPASCFRVI